MPGAVTHVPYHVGDPDEQPDQVEDKTRVPVKLNHTCAPR